MSTFWHSQALPWEQKGLAGVTGATEISRSTRGRKRTFDNSTDRLLSIKLDFKPTCSLQQWKRSCSPSHDHKTTFKAGPISNRHVTGARHERGVKEFCVPAASHMLRACFTTSNAPCLKGQGALP